MRRALTLISVLALLLAASYAHRVKIETRKLEREVASLRQQVVERRAAVATLNAEWAYLNRPERLLRLAGVFGEEMDLKPRRPDAFARVEEIPISGERVRAAARAGLAAGAPLDLSDLEAPIMGALDPQAPAEAAAAQEEAPLFPDYEEVVTAPEFVGDGVGEAWAEGAHDPYGAALVESEQLPPPLPRSGPVATPAAGFDPAAAPSAPGFGFAPPAGAPAFAPQAIAPQAAPTLFAPAAPPVAAGATGYALPPGAVAVPAQGFPPNAFPAALPGGAPSAAYPSAPAGFAPPQPYNAPYPGAPAGAVFSAPAPQPVFAPNPAPPPRIEVWEPLE